MSTTATTTARRDEDRRKSRKGIIGLAAMATAGALVVGLGFAYFSDTIDFGGSATAGTLDLSGTTTVTATDGLTVDNFVSTNVSGTSVANLNPGDMVKVAGDITNEGNKSAWIRTVVTGSADTEIAPYLYVYAGESVPTQAAALAASDPTSLPGYVGTLSTITDAGFVTPNKVIAGTGDNAEQDGTLAGGASDNVYNQSVVVYFDKSADNDAQDEDFSLTAEVQAIQYRNNNAGTGYSNDAPSAPTGGWSDVVATPFGN